MMAEVEEHTVAHLRGLWFLRVFGGQSGLRTNRSPRWSLTIASKGDQVPMTLQVANDRRTRVLFAHMVPRRGQCHEHGAEWKNFEKLGHHAVILKCDGQRQ